jgi:hypothetical protein
MPADSATEEKPEFKNIKIGYDKSDPTDEDIIASSIKA